MLHDFAKQRQRLVEHLRKGGRIRSPVVEEAFLAISRELFVPEHQKRYAYIDRPLDIGSHQTISAPHMVAIMVEASHLQKGQKILEIGAGSGYHAAIISYIIGEKGQVYSVERIASLAETAQKNLRKAGITNVHVIAGDGSMGHKQNAPYDHIYVTCASPSIPQPLMEQLKEGGSLLIPIGERICELQRVTKKDDELTVEHICGCAFVPLIGKYGF